MHVHVPKQQVSNRSSKKNIAFEWPKGRFPTIDKTTTSIKTWARKLRRNQMATVVYGGSPRHHNRIMVTSSGIVPAVVVPNFHKPMLPVSIPPPPMHSYASASYHHQCHGPNQIGHHQQQYATFTSTSIISQTKIYAPPKTYGAPGQPKLHKQLPPTPPTPRHQQQQPQLPPQLPLKMRQRHHPSNASVGSIPMESAAARFIKRKTAVELLAESKPYYVKSEVVLDRKQHLNQLRSGGRSTDAKLSPPSDSSKMPCKF